MSPTRITTTERVWSYFVDAILLPFIPQFQGSTSNILDSFLCLRLWPPYPHHSPAWQWSQAADGFISFLLKVSHLCLILAASCKPELILNASGKIHCAGEMLTNKYSKLHNWHRTCSNCMEFVKGSRLDQESQTEHVNCQFLSIPETHRPQQLLGQPGPKQNSQTPSWEFENFVL